MEKTKAFYLVAVFAVSALLLSTVNAQTIPEEARRHMARGQATVEMAKSPDEYDSAINEFQQASSLAPDWPDPYFQLANLQEKTGKLKEAVASLKEYLRLAPNTPDASKLQEQIYKLEYKAEQMLTVPEIIDVLVSGFQYSEEWKYSSTVKTGNRECRRTWQEMYFWRESSDTVRALMAERYYQPVSQYFQTLKVTEPVFRYTTTINVCGPSANKELGGCDSVIEHEVEVVSKNLIKINQKVIRGGEGAGVVTSDRYSCNFQLSEK